MERRERELATLKAAVEKGPKSGKPLAGDVVFERLRNACAKRQKARNGAREASAGLRREYGIDR